MGQNEGEVFHPPSPVQGRVEEHQRKPSPTIYVLHGRTFLCGHGPQAEWAKGFHGVDQVGWLLSWTCS